MPYPRARHHSPVRELGVGIDVGAWEVELVCRRFLSLQLKSAKNYDVGSIGTFHHVIITDITEQPIRSRLCAHWPR